MENASKALLIAGAILIVILLIGVGMLVYNSATGTVDEAISQMSSQEVQMFNTQFTQYEGQNVTGSNVKALVERVNTNNAINPSPNAKFINLSGGDYIDGTAPNQKFKGSTAQKYIVAVTDTNGDGLVDNIVVSLKVTTTTTT